MGDHDEHGHDHKVTQTGDKRRTRNAGSCWKCRHAWVRVVSHFVRIINHVSYMFIRIIHCIPPIVTNDLKLLSTYVATLNERNRRCKILRAC